jgi:hypothetical protein
LGASGGAVSNTRASVKCKWAPQFDLFNRLQIAPWNFRAGLQLGLGAKAIREITYC